ncbi:MAG: cupin domain-containing protein [Theionarchaea archaeon]|nr:cupin domain-containing protein [Theionarchaea archaeon]MBU7000724.1 cupin domain-containing protein [Theionarchaea archaeon]MBU7021493.1 cupin domain-containing protein [Theionarchaea archaeon]MBU7033566.1 cupin domain-containing protein [Theionarchaea archaeon]MBU7039624.1 cupin domain-containing protein [Theionarchaea archaeon]
MYTCNVNDSEGKEIIPGYRGRFVHSENMTLAYWNITAGAALPEHTHPHEQVVNVIEGTMELTVEGEVYQLGEGSVLVIPGGVPHAGKSITRCRVIDVFFPVREDYQ